MISLDQHEGFSPWLEKSETSSVKTSRFDDGWNFFESDPFNLLFGSSAESSADGFYPPLDLSRIEFTNMEIEKNSSDYNKWGVISPTKQSMLEDSFCNNLDHLMFKDGPDLNLINKNFVDQSVPRPLSPITSDYYSRSAPLSPIGGDYYPRSSPCSPDSGIVQDGLNETFDECANVFSLIEQDEANGMCEPVKVNTESDIDRYIENIILHKPHDEIFNDVFGNIGDFIGADFIAHIENEHNVILNESCWLNDGLSYSAQNNEDYYNLHSSLVLQPVKKEIISTYEREDPYAASVKSAFSVLMKEEHDDKLFVLRKNSQTIQIEHNYYRKPLVVESEEEEEEPVKKRKRDEIDEDFTPYQKPKRKAGRPRTNFSKVTPKTTRITVQKTKITPNKRTTYASNKKLKTCSTVPFDRREQHNQAERERRDMLKKNLDIVEDIVPDHVLHLTQLALQSEKTTKSDEYENNENNFTVDVLKKLEDLFKKEPFSLRHKYKKASRNSKMVVLLGATFFVTFLNKDCIAKETRLAQVQKQYEDLVKRLHPTKSSSSKKKRHHY